MSEVPEIQQAINRLEPSELAQFREWFTEFDATAWDRQLEQDAASGRLDALANEAVDDLRSGSISHGSKS
jgi:hypothetical protein